MSTKFFTTKTKLAEILHTNLQLVVLFPRLNILLGFGEKNIEQYCKEHHLSEDFIVLMCNVYTFNEYQPSHNDIINMNNNNLIQFLLSSHEYYLKERIPHISNHLHKTIINASQDISNIVLQFFNEYQKEVKKHFRYEEKEIFPYMYDIQNKEKVQLKNKTLFEKHHINIEDKLNDLINIVIKYLPSQWQNQDRISLLMDLSFLLQDMKKHAIIEEKILIPYIKYLEEL